MIEIRIEDRTRGYYAFDETGMFRTPWTHVPLVDDFIIDANEIRYRITGRVWITYNVVRLIVERVEQ